MNENDLSAWFVANLASRNMGRPLPKISLEPAAIEAVYTECGRILGDQPTAKNNRYRWRRDSDG